MTRKDLETTFKTTLLKYVPRVKVGSTMIEEYVDEQWLRTESFLAHQPVYTVDLICRSFKLFPAWVFNAIIDFDLVVLAACMQYSGPDKGGNNGYTRHVLEHVLGWPENKIRQVVALCQVRTGVTIPTFPPSNYMYDFNLMRLSFPRADFLTNMSRVFMGFGRDEANSVLEKQITLFKFLLNRKCIYATEHGRSQNRESQAMANIAAYVEGYSKYVKVSENKEVEEKSNLILTN